MLHITIFLFLNPSQSNEPSKKDKIACHNRAKVAFYVFDLLLPRDNASHQVGKKRANAFAKNG